MNILNITSYDVWGYKDCGTCIPFVLDINHESSTSSAFTNIFDHIRHAILQIRPINVVTHNPYGEYGHAQHVELSRLLTSIIQNDKLYYFNPSILKEIHDDQDDDDDDPFTILKQNIPTMRVIYPQEFGRTMAFDTTMSLPFIKAIDFINNINYIRHVLHIYCIDINTKWDVKEHVQNCYQKELIQDLILRDNIRVQSTIMKHQLENINIYNHHQSIAGSPNPLYFNQHINKLYDDIIQCMMNQYKIPLLSLLSRNTTMITTSTATTNFVSAQETLEPDSVRSYIKEERRCIESLTSWLVILLSFSVGMYNIFVLDIDINFELRLDVLLVKASNTGVCKISKS